MAKKTDTKVLATATATATDLVRDTVLKINAADEQVGGMCKRLAAAAVVYLVDNGGEKTALNSLRTMVDDLASVSTRKHVMAWAPKGYLKHEQVAKAKIDESPDAALAAVLEAFGDEPWRKLREEFRAGTGGSGKIRATGSKATAPVTPPTDGTATVLPPASSVVPLTALQAVLNRLPELPEAELQRVVAEATALLAEKVAEREAHVAASVANAKAA